MLVKLLNCKGFLHAMFWNIFITKHSITQFADAKLHMSSTWEVIWLFYVIIKIKLIWRGWRTFFVAPLFHGDITKFGFVTIALTKETFQWLAIFAGTAAVIFLAAVSAKPASLNMIHINILQYTWVSAPWDISTLGIGIVSIISRTERGILVIIHRIRLMRLAPHCYISIVCLVVPLVSRVAMSRK